MLRAVFDPAVAMVPGAPVLHPAGAGSRAHAPDRNVAAELHGGFGDVPAGLAAADAIHAATYVTQRVQHAALETHGAVGWLDEAGAAGDPQQHAGAVPDPRRPVQPVRPARPRGSACWPPASAVASVASRRC